MLVNFKYLLRFFAWTKSHLGAIIFRRLPSFKAVEQPANFKSLFIRLSFDLRLFTKDSILCSFETRDQETFVRLDLFSRLITKRLSLKVYDQLIVINLSNFSQRKLLIGEAISPLNILVLILPLTVNIF